MSPDHLPILPRHRVLFVCMGNICRSPAAECVARHLCAQSTDAPKVEWDSAGTIGYHAGKPPDARMRSAARKRGIEVDGRARQLQPADFENFDLIITMDEDNLREAKRVARDQAARQKLIPMVAFSRLKPSPHRIPDPYYGGEAGFEEVLDLLGDACANLIDRLRQCQKDAK